MVEQLDRKLLVILRDGRHLVGILRTFDQYSNMVLQETSERRILVVTSEESETTHQQRASDKIGNSISLPPSSKTICYQTDIELGLFIVRGDNVVLFGEVDDEEESIDGLVRFVSLDEFQQLEEEEEQRQANGGKEALNLLIGILIRIWSLNKEMIHNLILRKIERHMAHLNNNTPSSM